jgi:hypothetical protein
VAASAAVAAARLRDVGGSLAEALRWRGTARRWQRGGSSAVAAAVAAAQHCDVGGSLAAARDGQRQRRRRRWTMRGRRRVRTAEVRFWRTVMTNGGVIILVAPKRCTQQLHVRISTILISIQGVHRTQYKTKIVYT